MDDANGGAKPDPEELEPRPPVQADLVALCRELNRLRARYVVIGGFAVISCGMPRMTMDIDLMVGLRRSFNPARQRRARIATRGTPAV